MFASILTAALLASSVVLGAPIRAAASRKSYVPSDYREDLLEPYFDYHVRYMALGCQSNHGKQFFDDCCHPLRQSEKLSDRPAQCTPSAPASSSAVVVESTVSEVECSEEQTSTVPPPSSTSAVQATTTSSSVVVATTTAVVQTSKTVPPQTSTKVTSAPTTTQTSGGGGDVNTGGFATYFYQNGVAGACGQVHGEGDLIVAMDERRYGNPGQKSALCGKTVRITNTKNGKSVNAVVADDCPTCKNSNSIDLSKGAFEMIANLDDGMVPISWTFA